MLWEPFLPKKTPRPVKTKKTLLARDGDKLIFKVKKYFKSREDAEVYAMKRKMSGKEAYYTSEGGYAVVYWYEHRKRRKKRKRR